MKTGIFGVKLMKNKSKNIFIANHDKFQEEDSSLEIKKNLTTYYRQNYIDSMKHINFPYEWSKEILVANPSSMSLSIHCIRYNVVMIKANCLPCSDKNK